MLDAFTFHTDVMGCDITIDVMGGEVLPSVDLTIRAYNSGCWGDSIKSRTDKHGIGSLEVLL